MKYARLWVFIGIVIVALVAAYIFRDFIRDELLVPLVYSLWIIQLYIESVPQVFVWLFLIVIAVILMLKVLFKFPRRVGSRGQVQHMKMGQVETWLEWIERSKRGHYFRSRLARRLAEFTIDYVAFEKRIDERDAERGLQHGMLDLPEDLQRYLQRGLERENWGSFYGSLENLRAVLGQQSYLYGGLELPDVVTKLEERIKRGSSNER